MLLLLVLGLAVAPDTCAPLLLTPACLPCPLLACPPRSPGCVNTTVCSHKVFTEIEDRPIVKERVATIVEHRPVEKRYVTEVR